MYNPLNWVILPLNRKAIKKWFQTYSITGFAYVRTSDWPQIKNIFALVSVRIRIALRPKQNGKYLYSNIELQKRILNFCFLTLAFKYQYHKLKFSGKWKTARVKCASRIFGLIFTLPLFSSMLGSNLNIRNLGSRYQLDVLENNKVSLWYGIENKGMRNRVNGQC